jgi:uncharacterized membrane protein YfcA
MRANGGDGGDGGNEFGSVDTNTACYTGGVPRNDWFIESAGTLAGTILIGVGIFTLFVSIGMVTHLVFSVVLKPGASQGYVVGTAIAATLIVAASALILWSLGIRLSHLPRWLRKRAARNSAKAS